MTCQGRPAPLELILRNDADALDPSAANTVSIAIGTPLQQLQLTPALDATDIAIHDSVQCGTDTNGTCASLIGGVFNRGKESQFSIVQYSNWNGTHRDRLGTSSSIFFNEAVSLGSQKTMFGVPGLTIGGNAPGMLPLGPNSSFVTSAFQSGLIPSNSWALYAGSETNPGSLILGGYSSKFIAGPINGREIMDQCGMCASVKTMKLNLDSQDIDVGVQNLDAAGFNVNFNPYENYLTLPGNIFDAFLAKTNGTVGPSSFAQWPAGSVPRANLTLNFGTQLMTVTTIPSDMLFASSPPIFEGSQVQVDSSMRIARVRRTDDKVGTLGLPYMSNIYMIYDNDRGTFNISNVNPSATSQGQFTSICPPEMPGSVNHTAAIVGGTIGGVVALLLIIATVLFVILRRRNRNRQSQGYAKHNGREVMEIDSQFGKPTPSHSVSSNSTLGKRDYAWSTLQQQQHHNHLHQELPTTPPPQAYTSPNLYDSSPPLNSPPTSHHTQLYELPVETSTQIAITRPSLTRSLHSVDSRDDRTAEEGWSSLGGPTLTWGGRTGSDSGRTLVSPTDHSDRIQWLVRDGKAVEQWNRL